MPRRASKPAAKRAPRRPGWIDWKKSVCKRIVLDDLISGVLPLEQSEMTAEEAWEVCYKHLAEFVSDQVEFSQFKVRLEDHRKQVGGDLLRAQQDAAAVQHDRALFPRQERNARGELVFDMHPAKALLRADVQAGRHLTMKPEDLQATREEYMEFDKVKFRHRIYQEIRYQKFVNYLEIKRAGGK